MTLPTIRDNAVYLTLSLVRSGYPLNKVEARFAIDAFEKGIRDARKKIFKERRARQCLK